MYQKKTGQGEKTGPDRGSPLHPTLPLSLPLCYSFPTDPGVSPNSPRTPDPENDEEKGDLGSGTSKDGGQ